MKTTIFTLLSTLMLLFSSLATAQVRDFEIDLGDRVYRDHSVLTLRQFIESQHPRIDLENWNLEKVRLVAKSHIGKGQARLVVGNWKSHQQTVAGRPVDWDWNHPRSFDRVDFYNQVRNDDGKHWQIHLDGNFKVRKVIITAKRERRRGGRTVFENCSSRNDRYVECEQPSRIVDAKAYRVHPSSRCREDRDWGFFRNILWVDNGCRATFELELAR